MGVSPLQLLVSAGIIGALTTGITAKINPEQVLEVTHAAARSVTARELTLGLYAHLIDEGNLAGDKQVPVGHDNAIAICKPTISNDSCLNLDELVPVFVNEIPVDMLQDKASLLSGYALYQDGGGRPQVVYKGK